VKDLTDGSRTRKWSIFFLCIFASIIIGYGGYLRAISVGFENIHPAALAFWLTLTIVPLILAILVARTKAY